MLEYIKNEANRTLTQNGAATLSTTGSDCLDLFATIGALRNATDADIINRFIRAYVENADMAMKILFFARDIRGGLGERRVFRVIMNWLGKNKPQSVLKNLSYIAEFGRYDDLLSLFGTNCENEMLAVIENQLAVDLVAASSGGNVSLLAKWLPSVNASNKDTVLKAKKIAKHMKMSDAEYRKTLSRLRGCIDIIENRLRTKDYSFDYEKQPSRALFKYRAAFWRNDDERYNAFLDSASRGEVKLHADCVSPYELVEPYLVYNWRNGSYIRRMSKQEEATLNATWESLPDFDSDENALAVIDTSGSMYGWGNPMPASVALSLGLYFAQHNKGRFTNHFITFSHRPQLVEIKGETFVDKLRYVASFSEVADTDIEAVFDLVLNTAVKNKLPQSELPSRLVIISDMEFNECAINSDLTNFENAKAKYEAAGYKLPQLVFWNVASRNVQQPVTMNEQGAILVSGATPRLFSMVAGDDLSPYEFMLEVVNSERYKNIAA